MTTTRTRLAGALATSALAVTALTVLGAAPASAGDDRVITTGACSGSTDWKMKAKTDDNRIEFEGEIDSNRNGQVWAWRILHNGSVSARGQATTQGPSGSFSVERRMVNLSGTDHFVFRAVNNRSGEVCRGTLNF